MSRLLVIKRLLFAFFPTVWVAGDLPAQALESSAPAPPPLGSVSIAYRTFKLEGLGIQFFWVLAARAQG